MFPLRGEAVKVTATGKSRQKLENGAEIQLKFKKGIFRKTYKQKVCEGSKMKCPSKDFDVEFEEHVGHSVPDGSYDVEVKVTNDGKDLACLKGKVDI